ncbi:hypothetical protein [Humidisolicoccus flavus]|uniref:hypothetical protein n=1 Tax=Humidisolicoccus flavus TaxID=3111414 RepID=UPI00325632D5
MAVLETRKDRSDRLRLRSIVALGAAAIFLAGCSANDETQADPTPSASADISATPEETAVEPEQPTGIEIPEGTSLQDEAVLVLTSYYQALGQFDGEAADPAILQDHASPRLINDNIAIRNQRFDLGQLLVGTIQVGESALVAGEPGDLDGVTLQSCIDTSEYVFVGTDGNELFPDEEPSTTQQVIETTMYRESEATSLKVDLITLPESPVVECAPAE